MDDETVAAYLARIGARPGAAPDAVSVCDLAYRHVTTVPFENIDIHLGRRLSLTEDALVDKIVRRRRGGFCYELNGLFAMLLTALGYDVTLLAARVWSGGSELGPPLDHLALRVDLDEPWLVDVGFGRHALYPLRLDDPADQQDPEGMFRIQPAGVLDDLDVWHDGSPIYRVSSRPMELADFAPMCWYQQTSPESGFTAQLTCSLPQPDGRVTISGLRLVRTLKGERSEEELTEAEALAVYRDVFGFELDHVPMPGDPAVHLDG